MEKGFKKVKNKEISYLLKKSSNKNNKELILFLHGWGQSKECFLSIINDLELKKDIIAIDLPGFGDSEEPGNESLEENYITEYYADSVNEFLEQFTYDNIALVSHSFGGRISFWLANKNSKIKNMLLTGAAGIKPKRDLSYYFSVYGFKIQKFLLKTPFYSQYKDDVLKNSGSEDYKNASNMMKKVLIKTVNEDLKFLLGKIKQKVFLFWGEYDEATPIEDAYLMKKLIRNSELEVVKGTHYAFLENQDEFIKKIKEL